jgi:hypothetical protein
VEKVVIQRVTHTWLNVAWSGGQEHGTLIGRPFAPFTAPSQSPVPDEGLQVRCGIEIVIEDIKPTGRVLSGSETKLRCQSIDL